MAKRDISMSDEEVDTFLADCSLMVVGAVAADGWPVGTIAASTYCDGVLSLRFVDGDPVRAELARDPRVCCTADVHDSYFEIKGVTVHGLIGADDCVATDHVISFDFGRLR